MGSFLGNNTLVPVCSFYKWEYLVMPVEGEVLQRELK